MDYPVPNFGMDHDIKHSEASEEWASKEVGHTWVWQKVDKPTPVEYKIEPLDVDMRVSLDNLKMEEAIHGFWEIDPQNVQIESTVESDPICSSAGCTQYKLPDDGSKWPMDYFVPNFGVDHDIKASHEDLKIAEK